MEKEKRECSICGKSFKPLGLSTHIRIVHDKSFDPNREFKNGNKKIWNTGLTKTSDNRIKNLGKKISIKQEGTKRKPHSSKTKEKLSLIRSRILEEKGNGGYKNIRWFNVKNNKNEEFIVRGSWELNMASWLNKQNINWIRKIYLKYNIDGVNRNYTPDFYLPDHDIYLEIKGYFSEKDQNKINAVKSQNDINLILIFGKTIEQLENIDSIENLLK